MIELSVVVPCFNEAGNLPELIKRTSSVFNKIGKNCELILVDDSSNDQTVEIIKSFLPHHPEIKLVQHEKNKGMATAWVSGLEIATGTYVSLIDADLQYQPEDIYRLYAELQNSNSDIVQGYRSIVGRNKDSRYILSRVLNIFLNTMFGMHLKDNKSGFIICRREVLKDVFIKRFNYSHFQSLLLVSAYRKGYSIRQVEVLFTERLVGKSFISKIPIKLVSTALIDLMIAFYEYQLSDKKTTILSKFIQKYNPQKGAPDRNIFKKLRLLAYFYTMPLHAWLISRNVRTYYNELSKSQWFTPEQMRELQLAKLKIMLSHAYKHVPYYREQFDKIDFKPEELKSIDDLSRLPLLSKTEITANLHFGILSDNHDKRKMIRIVTSGSTGTPFTCYADKFQIEMRWAATLRSMEWTGYVFGDKCARLWHQTIGMTTSQIIREFIDSWLSRRIFIPAFSISSDKIKKYMKRLERYKPVLLDGYAESLNFLASYTRTHGAIDIAPKGVISSAQILPPQSREIIEEQFHTKVYDKYGSREFSGIAYESSSKDGHLVVAENYIVEIIKDGRKALPGETGEIVITDLNNFCMPFIRYKIGDLAVAIDDSLVSSCGRGLPMLGKIEGRSQAIIIGTNQNYLPGSFFAHFIKDYPHVIAQYQIIQNVLGSVELKIIKGERHTDEEMAVIIQVLRTHLGQKMQINLEYVNHIAMVRTGKHQGVISNLKIDFQDLDLVRQ